MNIYVSEFDELFPNRIGGLLYLQALCETKGKKLSANAGFSVIDYFSWFSSNSTYTIEDWFYDTLRDYPETFDN